MIWAIGSSFTNGLGNGDLLIELIRQRFPQAPPINVVKFVARGDGPVTVDAFDVYEPPLR